MKILNITLLVALALVTLPAQAAPAAPPQILSYEVYAGGFNVVDAEFDLAMPAKDRYKISLSAATKGLLKKVAPWRGSFETTGWLSKAGPDQPQLHRSVATWRNQDEVKEYSYDRSGHFVEYKIWDDENNGSKKPVDPALVDGTIDVLTAALAVMKTVGDGGPCIGSSDIFDGDRRFEIDFRDKGEENLTSSRYNVYDGPAQRCEIEIKPKGGKWHEKPRGWLSIQEQGRQHGMLPTVWFARLDDIGPAVPVKIMIKSDYGAMLMHLSGYRQGKNVIHAPMQGNEPSQRSGR